MSALDPLRVFLGAIPDDEHALRSRIAAARDCATWSVNQTACPAALTLLWLVVETASAWLYLPADTPTLERVAKHLHSMLQSATLAQELEVLL